MSPLLILFNGPSITTYESSYAFLHHVFFSLCLNIFLNVLPFSLSIFHYLMHCSFSLFLLCHSTLLIVILLPFFLFLPISTVPWSTFQLQTTRHAPYFYPLSQVHCIKAMVMWNDCWCRHWLINRVRKFFWLVANGG